MKLFTFAQYTPEFWQERRGRPSASNADRILTPTGKSSASQIPYACELAAEIADLRPNFFTNRPMNKAMEDGINSEPDARAWLESKLNQDIHQVGGCMTDDGHFWCSPDGIIGDITHKNPTYKDCIGVEIKCPELRTQAKYLIDGELPSEYKPQVHFSLALTGFSEWLFLSYAVGLPPLFIRVYPDDYTAKMREAMKEFHGKYLEVLRKLGLEPRKAE